MSGQNNNSDNSLQERERYVKAFNRTMIRIWKEQIAKLGVIDTGALYNSVMAISTNADGKYTSVTLKQKFLLYGIFVDAGVGSNTPRGNPGDIGRDNPRKRRRWFSKKYYASVMNLREFYADNLGKDMANAVSNALGRDIRRKFM